MSHATHPTSPVPGATSGGAETDGLGRIIESASEPDLLDVAALIQELRERFGDDADRKLELLVAIYLQHRIKTT